jgi:hypothetical protein
MMPAGSAAVYLPIGDLHPNPRNPRVHGAELAALARTILRTAWGAPIIAQASTRRIIGGHGRVEAARAIMAGIVVDGVQRGGPDHRFDPEAPGPGMVPVRLVNVSDAEADAMTLADNARALQGVDDAAAVVAMATASFDAGAAIMADIGLGVTEIEALTRGATQSVLLSSLPSPPVRASPPAAPNAPPQAMPGHSVVAATDPNTEWQGMPVFEQKDKTAFRSLAVHFNTQEDVDRFATLVGQKVTDRTRYLWFPEIVIERYADKVYK